MFKVQSRPENVSEFLTCVREVREHFKFQKDDPFGPWFRGHQRAYWLLCPKLYREYGDFAKIKEERLEDEIREEFVVRAPALSESALIGKDEWESYFLMQHFGAPTRLLDWTEGALIALYFAVRDNPGFYDSAVWSLDPYMLNDRAIGKDEVIPPTAIGLHKDDKKLVDPWLPARFKELAGLPEVPVAVYPTHVARRISTQRSCFTVHGKQSNGLDKLTKMAKSCLVKIVIPSFSATAIRRELEASGIDEATIYPDLGGLSRTLAVKWRSDTLKPPHEGVYTRLRPSKIHKGGVGVFAIVPIKKGTPLFSRENEEMLWLEEVSLPAGDRSEIRALYDDFAVIRGKRYGCPPTFNRLTMAWYLNEPKRGEKPNVVCDSESYDFFALANIKAGDELTVNYSDYSDEPSGEVKKAIHPVRTRR